MYLPRWAQKFKEPRTEIRFINGGYYKYQVSYKYNPQKKRTDKITGALLGKITEEEGFIPSDKNKLRQKLEAKNIDIKNFGLSALFFSLVKEEFDKLKEFFTEEECRIIFCFAMYRWAYNAPIKRVPYYYHHDFCTEGFGKKSITDKNISATLKYIGENRTKVVSWMKSLLGNKAEASDRFVMMDSTHIVSKSELLTINAKGYNPNLEFDKQIRLMYLFSAEIRQPVYYRLINGNIPDVKSMHLCLEEMKVAHVIYIADKGFYSKANIKAMKEMELQYIIPLRRDNKAIDYTPLLKANFKPDLSYFRYRERIIWYYSHRREENDYITFLDEGLRAGEESDYVDRIARLPEKYSSEKFRKKLVSFGTLTFTYDMRADKSAEEIYQAYKQRNEIEVVFDAYKNFLEADVMYMQNRYVIEGWLQATNFIAMIAYHKLYMRMREVKQLDKYAPRDIIELSKSIYKIKIGNKWQTAEITKKTDELFKLIAIDYLK